MIYKRNTSSSTFIHQPTLRNPIQQLQTPTWIAEQEPLPGHVLTKISSHQPNGLRMINPRPLLIKLPGFREEQLKVQIDSKHNSKTSGQRLLDGNNTRWRSFSKDIRIPETLNFTGIRARFGNGTLHVIIPKLFVTKPAQAPTQEAPTNQKDYSAPTPALPPQRNGKAKVRETAEIKEKEKYALEENFANVKESPADEHWMTYGSDGGATGLERQQEKGMNGAERSRQLLMNASIRQLLLNVAVAILVLVGVGVYVSYTVKRDNIAAEGN